MVGVDIRGALKGGNYDFALITFNIKSTSKLPFK